MDRGVQPGIHLADFSVQHPAADSPIYHFNGDPGIVVCIFPCNIELNEGFDNISALKIHIDQIIFLVGGKKYRAVVAEIGNQGRDEEGIIGKIDDSRRKRCFPENQGKEYAENDSRTQYDKADTPVHESKYGHDFFYLLPIGLLQRFIKRKRNGKSYAKLGHTKAMHLLRAGVNMIYIRDFLGHADISTTEVYARIDAEMKRKVFEEKVPNYTPNTTMPWEEDEDLLQWLTQFGKKTF